jgi:hypothetical protein
MNETIEPYVKKLLDGGMKTAEDVAKFIETQTPELGKEMIAWGAVSEIVAPLIGLTLFLTMLILHIRYKDYENYYCGSSQYPPGFPYIAIPGMVGMIIFIAQIMDVIYPLVAPRLYILEKIASFIK